MNPFSLPSNRGMRLLLFSEEGGGKTHIASGVARMTDRYLYIDNEGSADEMALHHYTEKEPWGVVTLDKTTAGNLSLLLSTELGLLAKGKGRYDVVVLDGITEQSIIESYQLEEDYTKKYGRDGSNERTLRRYGDLLVSMTNIIQSLVAISNYGTGIIVTAMAERSTDPEFPAGLEARPLCSGSIRHLLGKYFTLTIFVEVTKGPKHVYHFIRDGAYRVKNRFEDIWLADPAKFPPSLTNPTTEQIVSLIQEAARRKNDRTDNA